MKDGIILDPSDKFMAGVKNMKNKITEAQLLLNNEVKVTDARSRFFGHTGIVAAIMADGRTLDIDFFGTNKPAFVDVTMVREIHEPVKFAKGEPDLGPIANSVVQSGK